MFFLLYVLPMFLSATSLLYICCLICWLLQALSVRDILKDLVQLWSQKAQAIVELYHTRRVIITAYWAEGSAGEQLPANICYGSWTVL
jgi:hypothetical protein